MSEPSAFSAPAPSAPAAPAPPLASPADWPAERFLPSLARPWLMRAFLFRRLPMALVAGLRIRDLSRRRCAVTVPYGWRTTNPFHSTYFAALAMAAELSTGALALLATRSAPRPAAMLLVAIEATFGKKATALSTFTCEDGDAIFAAVAQTLADGAPATVRAHSIGRSPDGAELARFTCTWSFKRRASPAAART
jgi:hypothetical protein